MRDCDVGFLVSADGIIFVVHCVFSYMLRAFFAMGCWERDCVLYFKDMLSCSLLACPGHGSRCCCCLLDVGCCLAVMALVYPVFIYNLLRNCCYVYACVFVP